MYKIKCFFIIIFSVFLFNSCTEHKNYAPEPLIDFKQIVIKDTIDTFGNFMPKIYLYFKVIDGDGNFGYRDSTYAETDDTTNFFLTMYQKKNGEIVEYDNDMLNGAIPWTEPVGLNKYYKSTVIYENDLLISDYPTKFKFYVRDNDLNESNIQSTMWFDPSYRGVLVDSVDIID